MKKTEMRNEKSTHIDKMSSLEIVSLMNNEDKTVAFAVEKALPEIAKTVDKISQSFNKNGRLIYIGAGTSGRLGVLDASECPPTFGASPDTVVGIIAGGLSSLTRASENQEDLGEKGKEDLENINVNENDTVVGISVSGDAEYIVSALEYAKKKGANTVALTCNENSKISKVSDITILTDTGAEVISGSTRLKAGTAQKMVLNMLSTAAMIRTGQVIENLMVNVTPTNIKLFDRAARIVNELTGLDIEQAKKELKSGLTIVEIVKRYKK